MIISTTQSLLGLASGMLVGFSLGLVGGGGSILAVPLMVYVVGVPNPHVAIGTSAIAVAANAAVNLSNHARGGTVVWSCALMFAAAGIAGAFAGSTAYAATSSRGLAMTVSVTTSTPTRGSYSSARAAPGDMASLCIVKAERTKEAHMALSIGDTAPDFHANTTEGEIDFHDWLGDSWGVLFSHPKDFTPVCTTELGYMARIEPEFTKRNAKLIGLSADPVDSHGRWAKDIEETQGAAVRYPIIADPELKVAKLYNMLPADEVGSDGRTAANNATVRSVFMIGPDKKIKLMLTYPMTTGRNFDEILRVLDSMQLTAKHQVATPAQWKPGEDVIIAGSVSDEDAKKKYPECWKTVKPYLRVVKQPTS